MNKRFLFLYIVLAFLLSSCLDETPKDQIPEKEIYDSANSLYVNAVASLYNYIGAHDEGEGLQGTCRGIYDYNTLTTDEAIMPIRGGNWYDGGLWKNMYNHTWTSSDTDLYNVWKYLYKVIVLSTKSLETIDQYKSLLTAQQREQYTAEVRAVRAMFYYYAMDMFGRIPVLQSSTQKIADIRQSNRSDVFNYIVNELQTVAPLLPNEHKENILVLEAYKKHIVNFTTNDDDRCELDLVNRELKKVTSSINTLVRYYQKDLISLEDYKKKHNELLVDKSVFEMQKCKLNEKIYQRFEVIQTQIIIECLESMKEITALDEEIFNTLVDSIEVGTLDIQFTLKNDLKLKVERKQF